MTLLVLYVVLAIGVSFACSVMEAVLLSVTSGYVGALERQDPPVGERLRQLKDEIERPLAAILTLNTIAHTVGATGAGAQAAVVFGSAAVGVFSAVLTFLILVLSEIIPKTLGAAYWRRLAPPVARVLPALVWLVWPLVVLSLWLEQFLSRGREAGTVSREEIAAMAEEGRRVGVVREAESRILERLFLFAELRAHDVMTPRTVVFTLPAEATLDDVIEEHDVLPFSRIPLHRGDPGEMDGYVLKDELLRMAASGEGNAPLEELRRDFLVVPESLALPDLFERLEEEGELISLVVNEHGSVEGIVSMEDVIETILGREIVDEADSVEDMRELARQHWRRRARRMGIDVEEAWSGEGAEEGGRR
ncbi:MAG: CNNM domain-containing protein [Gemmatimonadota bacterium]